MTMTLWHCKNSRSLRPLWALEEMGLPYELVSMKFPPRVHHPDYLEVNSLGTVPFFRDGDVTMTESSAICHYLVERYQKFDFGLRPDHPEYGDYLNWLYHSDATLTFPQTLILRYAIFEPESRRSPRVAEDYRQWYLARLRKFEAHIVGREYLCDNRFTIADICVGYALYLGKFYLGLDKFYSSKSLNYLEVLMSRPAFIKSCL